MTPLSYDSLEYAAEFSTEMCPEGVVAVSGEKLRIFGVERLGEMFNQAALPLRYNTIRLAVELIIECYLWKWKASRATTAKSTSHGCITLASDDNACQAMT